MGNAVRSDGNKYKKFTIYIEPDRTSFPPGLYPEINSQFQWQQ